APQHCHAAILGPAFQPRQFSAKCVCRGMMVRMKYLLLVLGLVGCGRVGFSPVEHSVMFDGGAGGADSDPDTGEGTRLVQISDPAAELAPSISTELTVTAGSTLVVATYWDTRNNTVDITDTMGLQWLGNVAFQNTSCFAPPKTSGAM